MPNHATAEGVAVAWLTGLGMPAVATTLPALTQWPVLSGTIRAFVTVGVVGAQVSHTPLRAPVLSVGTWAAVPNSDNPQWGAANELAERIMAAVYAHPFDPVQVQQSAKTYPALVHAAHLVQEPRRIPDPDTSRAHFETEFVLRWTEVR